MFKCILATAIFLAPAAFACDRPICLAEASEFRFTRLIDFDDLTTSIGIGSKFDHVIIRDGASFGERFAGQLRQERGDFDVIVGTPLMPLTVVDGGPGETLGTMRLLGSNVLHGHGHRRYPRVEAIGEGALAVLFDRDQPALGFDIRGGEAGEASVQFLRRDGSTIDTLTLGPLSEQSYVFHRNGMDPDIAGFLIVNTDPEGVAIDNLRFESNDVIG